MSALFVVVVSALFVVVSALFVVVSALFVVVSALFVVGKSNPDGLVVSVSAIVFVASSFPTKPNPCL